MQVDNEFRLDDNMVNIEHVWLRLKESKSYLEHVTIVYIFITYN